MKKKKHIISIPNPCEQAWEAMEIRPNGRFCNVCNESVYDFSRMSDAEIIRIIEQSAGKPCGRYNESQLNRLLLDPSTKERQAVWKVLASALLLSGSTVAFSQTTAPNVEISPQTTATNPTQTPPTKKPGKSMLFEGRVVNQVTGESISNATIHLKFTKFFIHTDSSGNFKAEIPDKYIQENMEFVAYMTQFESVIFFVPKASLPLCKKIELAPLAYERILMGRRL